MDGNITKQSARLTLNSIPSSGLAQWLCCLMLKGTHQLIKDFFIAAATVYF
jgi:hypothetical protein